jgi:hypothetical protein
MERLVPKSHKTVRSNQSIVVTFILYPLWIHIDFHFLSKIGIVFYLSFAVLFLTILIRDMENNNKTCFLSAGFFYSPV